MLVTMDRNRFREEIKALVKQHGGDRSALIPVLQDLQTKYSFISDDAMQYTADYLGIHPSEVYGVVSFYSFLGHQRRGKFIIRLCRTMSCEMNEKQRVAKQLSNDLGINFGETTADGHFTLEWANCIGMCDQGPALLVNERVYTKVTPASVNDILEECRRAFGVHAAQDREEENS